ncbi:MAG: serine/threonine-protein kinase [Planctomycetota bacterium]
MNETGSAGDESGSRDDSGATENIGPDAKGADAKRADEELLADLFDELLQDIFEGRPRDLDTVLPDRPDLKQRIQETWELACSVAGRREPGRPVFGGYDILRELGHGGMGTVYLARHLTLQRDVAIKVLPQSLAMSAVAKQRFLEEARSIAQLRHDNVVRVHRIIEETQMLAFEMEYIDGLSLQQLCSALRAKPRSTTTSELGNLSDALQTSTAKLGARSVGEWHVRVVIRIARALAEVHRNELVHRDVKPANILLRADGTPVLADFGLAMAPDLSADPSGFAGTLNYAAPERLRDAAPASASSDIYSLGATLFEALALQPPFAGSDKNAVLRQIEAGPTPRLRERAPDVSQDLATIVSKAMESDPKHRYESADEFADDLERLLNLQPIHARPAGPARRAVKFVRRHQRAVLAAAAGALLVTLVAWPLAAIASERSRQTERAEEARYLARTCLLRHEARPPHWMPSSRATKGARVVQQSSMHRGRIQALQDALGHYERALRATPSDQRLQTERNAVRRALRRIDGEGWHIPANSPATSAFAAGLESFLVGDSDAQTKHWQSLSPTLAVDPFVDACTALNLASESSAKRAYARVFRAARAFPQATGLMVVMVRGALSSGDLKAAHRWVKRLDVHAEASTPRGIPAGLPADASSGPKPHPLGNLLRLLHADIDAADGRIEQARTAYRAAARSDSSDPQPLVRLANLAMRDCNLDGARRILNAVLQRWPGYPGARRRIARICLLERDLPGYLSHVLAARDSDARAQKRVQALSGLSPTGETLAHVASVIPLQTFVPKDQLAGIRRVLNLLPTAELVRNCARAIDARPIATALLTVGIGAIRCPDVLLALPRKLQLALIASLPLWRHAIVPLSRQLLPYQRTLGARLRLSTRGPLIIVEKSRNDTYYGLSVLPVDDLDGDTLPDLCISSPAIRAGTGPSYLEVRSRQDGALLNTWQCNADTLMFARSMTQLGDVDGDQCSDVLLGSPHLRSPGPAHARVELRSGRSGEVIWQYDSDNPAFAMAVATLDDLDGDGVFDVAVGDPSIDLHKPGRVRILSGRSGAQLRELVAPAAGEWFGCALCATADRSGDGKRELLISGNFGGTPGSVYAFCVVTGKPLMTVHDSDARHAFGFAIAALPDLDSDGVSEFAVSSLHRGAGMVSVVNGRTGNSLFELSGENEGEQFGASIVAMPYWLDNDRPAIAVASRTGGPLGNGYVRVFDAKTGKPMQTFAGPAGSGQFGCSICDLGDTDGDGLRDLGILSKQSQGSVCLFRVSLADLNAPATTADAAEAAAAGGGR